MAKQQALLIDQVKISNSDPTYFIADIAANHDGNIERAKELIYLAAEAGAQAAKFQHFKAETIVSNEGFIQLKNNISSHQSSWKKSVFEVYKAASLNLEWTQVLKDTCTKAGISFFTSPYSFELVDYIDQYVPAYKIGSGDITWIEIIKHIAKKNKPYIIATGASSIEDVKRAVNAGLKINKKIAIMQCNTNYTADIKNFNYINLNVLKTYKKLFPNIILGLSDHTYGHSTVLGSITLGARMIEKHFTDDIKREGPDHKFSMDPNTWREMVNRSRELEASLGQEEKRIEDNEVDTVILQRRSLRLNHSKKSGDLLTKSDLCALRPCPEDGIPPYLIDKVIGKILLKDLNKGDHIKWEDIN